MTRTKKLSLASLLLIAGISLLFSFSQPISGHSNALPVLEGDPGPIVTVRTRKTNQQALEATVTLSKGAQSTTFQTPNGEAAVQSFESGVHQITISKAGYITINSSFDAKGETMTLDYTMVED